MPIAYSSRRPAALAAASLVAALIVASTDAAASPEGTEMQSAKRPCIGAVMQSAKARVCLVHGRSLHDVVVKGPFVLKGTVTQPFECTACTFRGPFIGHDAVFKRLVDLSGSTFKRQVNLKGAVFEAPVLFGSPEGGANFGSNADFTLVTFGDLADFETAKFAGTATFVLSRFRGDAIFAGVPLESGFEKEADFERASFSAAADFRQRSFAKSVDFRRVTFSGSSDFSGATFQADAEFNWTHFGRETTFLNATTSAGTVGMVLDNIRADGPIDFRAANINGRLRVANSEVPGLSFARANFCSDVGSKVECGLAVERVSSSDFFMDLGSIEHVNVGLPDNPADAPATTEARKTTLALIESSAKARGNLPLANDAHYRLQVLKSHDYSWPFYVLDSVFYRMIAGYLVRPLHPIVTLLALALLISFLRVVILVPETPHDSEAPSRVRPGWRRKLRATPDGLALSLERMGRLIRLRRLGSWFRDSFWPGLEQLGHELLDALSLIWPGSGAAKGGRRLEAAVYRVLVVCMLIGFANSNPTLRQMFDALL
jgi:uncharacterized protein YjbI with pentapeptide repeats